MRKNISMILSLMILIGMVFFSCGQSAGGGNDPGTGPAEETKASIRFTRLGGTSTIFMNLYDDLSAAFGIIMPEPSVQKNGTSAYYKVIPGNYYVTWTSVGNLHSALTSFEKGKKYTVTLNADEDAVIVTVDP